MKWFKHDSNAHRDAKLKRLIMRHGLIGYGLYFYCLERITEQTDLNNLTFELDYDAEILAHDLNIHVDDINRIMTYMVELELFEDSGGIITCMKLAKRIDQSMTGNPEMRRIISKLKPKDHDTVMTQSRISHDTNMTKSEQIRLDKNRIDKQKDFVSDFTPPEGINLQAWKELDEYRLTHKVRKVRECWTPKAKSAAVNLLLPLSKEAQLRCVQMTVANGWQGIFPDRINSQPHQKPVQSMMI